jgi:hypothetical protein
VAEVLQLLENRMMLITVHPDQIAPSVLSSIHTVIAMGQSPEASLRAFSEAPGQDPPAVDPVSLQPGEALLWSRQPAAMPYRLRIAAGRAQRARHRRKYSQGELGMDKSFYFRGPEGTLNLRAQNLALFMQLAEGVDDTTWTYHLRRGDYSRWFRDAIKDEGLAAESRGLIRAAIEQRYTLPASSANSVADHGAPTS